MRKKQMWRAMFTSWEKMVKYETSSFCASRKERHMLADYPALLSVPLSACWFQQTGFFPSDLHPLSVCSATPKIASVFLSCLSWVQQKWPRALRVCHPATVCCQETPVCYAVLQSNTLLGQLVLVLWNIEWGQCRLCHKRRLPISVLLTKRPCTVSAALGHWDLCWNGEAQLEFYVGGFLFCFVLVQHLKWVREGPEGCWRERMRHQRSDGFRLLWSWDLPSQSRLMQRVTAAQSVKCPSSQPCSR